MGGFPWLYMINEKRWQKLPGDIQSALMIAAKEYNKHFSENWENEGLKLVGEFEREGMVIHRILPKDREKWDAPLAGIEETWIQEMEKKGLPGKKVFAEFKKICQEVVK